MERWLGKLAVVSGASSGIGAATCKDLVKAGMIVVGLARRKERVEALRAEIPSEFSKNLHAVQCDVSDDADIARAFAWIEAELGAIHVMVNNAGTHYMGRLLGDDNNQQETLRNTLQTNLWGTIQCTRKAVEIMKRHKVVGAHVFMINSLAGHKVLDTPPGVAPQSNVYPVSKFGVTALSEVLRQEFNFDGLKYRVTSISPGVVNTEIMSPAMIAHLKYHLKPEDVSNAMLYVLSTPPHVQISELTIKPVGEQF